MKSMFTVNTLTLTQNQKVFLYNEHLKQILDRGESGFFHCSWWRATAAPDSIICGCVGLTILLLMSMRDIRVGIKSTANRHAVTSAVRQSPMVKSVHWPLLEKTTSGPLQSHNEKHCEGGFVYFCCSFLF